MFSPFLFLLFRTGKHVGHFPAQIPHFTFEITKPRGSLRLSLGSMVRGRLGLAYPDPGPASAVNAISFS